VNELLKAQKQLGRSLERASVGEDRQLAAAVREKGEAYANLFYGTMRMTRVYDPDNDAFKRPLEELTELLDWLIQHLGVVHLVTVEEQVYVNDIRIRFKSEAGAQHLGKEIHRHNVGGISFHITPSRAQLLSLLAGLGRDPEPGAERRTVLCQQLAHHGVTGIELTGVNRYLMAGEEQEESEWTEVLARAVDLVEETFDNVGSGRMLNPLALRRMVVELLSEGIEKEGLWRQPPGETEHGKHAVRVCRTALLIGSSVGLNDQALQDLGVAALVHDLGYATLGAARGAQGAPKGLKAHLEAGAMVMLGQRGFHAAKIHRILGILYHHHKHKDLVGTPSLFGRILRIAEDFDNLSQGRGAGMSQPTALSAMAGQAGDAYDPRLLQAAINKLGRYPPGTKLLLKDMRQVRSISLARSPETFHKPRTVLLRGDRRVIDLAQGGEVTRVLED
jgi:hypothetical protein